MRSTVLPLLAVLATTSICYGQAPVHLNQILGASPQRVESLLKKASLLKKENIVHGPTHLNGATHLVRGYPWINKQGVTVTYLNGRAVHVGFVFKERLSWELALKKVGLSAKGVGVKPIPSQQPASYGETVVELLGVSGISSSTRVRFSTVLMPMLPPAGLVLSLESSLAGIGSPSSSKLKQKSKFRVTWSAMLGHPLKEVQTILGKGESYPPGKPAEGAYFEWCHTNVVGRATVFVTYQDGKATSIAFQWPESISWQKALAQVGIPSKGVKTAPNGPGTHRLTPIVGLPKGKALYFQTQQNSTRLFAE